MSDSKLHKLYGRWKAGLLPVIPFRLQRFFNRHNFEIGEFTYLRYKKREEIAENDLKAELNNQGNERSIIT